MDTRTWYADGYRRFRMVSTGEKFYLGCLRLGQMGPARMTRRVFRRASEAERYSLRLAERHERFVQHTTENN